MIPVPNCHQIKEVDRLTIEHYSMSSLELMEQASAAFVLKFRELYPDQNTPIAVFCGSGNNGADGLAIAFMLHSAQYKFVSAVIIHSDKTKSDDYESNFLRLKTSSLPINIMFSVSALDEWVPEGAIIIDAIFGTGFKPPLIGLEKDTVLWLNQWQREVVSVDIPTGLNCELNAGQETLAVKAKHCISFQFFKLLSFFPDYSCFVKQWHLVPIGLHPDVVAELKTEYLLIEKSDFNRWVPQRNIFDHKGKMGHAFLVAGSDNMPGAALLSGEACLRSGVGLLSLHAPESMRHSIATRIPEALISYSGGEYYKRNPDELNQFSAIAIGPGLGKHKRSKRKLIELLEKNHLPTVLDADALNIIAELGATDKINAGTIITPHVKEFDRLFGDHASWEERIEKAKKVSNKLKIIILLKNAYTFIISPKSPVIINSSGNSGMASAGMGDVLTGIILAFLARGINPTHSAALGAYIHGLAGDHALQSRSPDSLIASDLIMSFGPVFSNLSEQ